MNFGTPPYNDPINKGGVLSVAWSEFMANVYRLLNGLVESGTTVQRPTKNLYTGRMYFDTTLGLPIWHDGTNWIDAAGNTV